MRLAGVTLLAAAQLSWTGAVKAEDGARSDAATPAPELMLERQFTFTGEVRDVLVLGSEVWAATGGGLAIFRRSDGAPIATLTSADGLPGNSLRSLAAADPEHVMVGTDFGVALVDVKKVLARKSHPAVKLGCEGGCARFDPAYAMAPVKSGIFVLRAAGGLSHWSRTSKGEWAGKAVALGELGTWRALAAASTPVLAGLDGRLLFLDGAGKTAARFMLPSPVLALQAHRDGDVLLATGERLLEVRPEGVRVLVLKHGASESPAASALSRTQSDGSILVGTSRGEILALAKGELARVADGLGGRVTSIASDGDRIWFGLGRAGLHLLVPGGKARALRPAGEICDNHVIALFEFRGRMVAATFDQGACVFESGSWRALEGLPSPMLHGLGSDGQDLFVASSNGLSRYDAEVRLRPLGRNDPAVLRWVAQSAVTAIAQIDESGLVITSAYGLVQIRRGGKRLLAEFTSHKAGIPVKLTSVASAHGEIWLGSETQGAKTLSKGSQPARQLQDPEDLPENWVTAMSAVGADELWVGTCQHGVARLRGQDRQFIDRRNLLPDNMVTAIAADMRGAFIGTLGGLTFVAAQGLVGKSYGWNSGIPDPRSASLLLAKSELWLGTESGLAQYGLR